MKMRSFAKILGISASIVSIVLWIVLIFFNPYTTDPVDSETITRTLMMLLLPACLALGATITARKPFLLIAFIWSLPMSIYLALTPSIFALFAFTSILYLMSYLILYFSDKRGLKDSSN